MSIHYGVVFDANGSEVEIGIRDHCFGLMRRMPWDYGRIQYDLEDDIGSDKFVIRNFLNSYNDGMQKQIKSVRLYDYNKSRHWSHWGEYKEFMLKLQESGLLRDMTHYEVASDYIEVPVIDGELWESFMPRLFFVRNLWCYSESLPKWLDEGMGVAHAAFLTLYFSINVYNDNGKVYPDSDCEYGFFDPAYISEDSYMNFVHREGSSNAGCGSTVKVHSENGYMREEDYLQDEFVWDSSSEDYDDGYYYALNKAYCDVTASSNILPPFLHFSSKDGNSISTNQSKIGEVAMYFKNWLISKGIENA